MTQLFNVTRNQVIVDQLEIADSPSSRRRGLLGHTPLGLRDGMLIQPCRWIHMFGMKFAIDVLYLNRAGTVVALTESLPPGRIDRPVLRAYGVVEMAAGAIRHHGIRKGDILKAQVCPQAG
jgi:uncharacterized protein